MAQADSLSSTATATTTAVPTSAAHWQYTRGIATGLASGATKLIIGHPFDTIKVRLQIDGNSVFKHGPLDCLRVTWRSQGIRGLYAGATPPLVGWGIIDSVLWSSLVKYRQQLQQYNNDHYGNSSSSSSSSNTELSILQHGIAGLGAGLTSCFVVVPVEQIKARLQVQYAVKTTTAATAATTTAATTATAAAAAAVTATRPQYTGPIDCAQQLIRNNGIAGLYKGFGATVLFRVCMSYYFASFIFFQRSLQPYDERVTAAIAAAVATATAATATAATATTTTATTTTTAATRPALSLPMNFVAGSCAAVTLWGTAYPFDLLKNKMMAQPDVQPRMYRSVWHCMQLTYSNESWRGFFRGYVPGLLRAVPVNGMSLVVTEMLLRHLPTGL